MTFLIMKNTLTTAVVGKNATASFSVLAAQFSLEYQNPLLDDT